MRPNFEQSFNPKTGEITVKVPPQNGLKLKKVKLEYGETFSSEKRDFRWIIKAPEGQCKLPLIPVPKSLTMKDQRLQGGYDLCLQLIRWRGINLKESTANSGEYVAQAPIPKEKGHWVGYYVNLFFETDTDHGHRGIWKNEFHVTSIGWTNPNTLPFEDCHDAGCIGKLV